MGAERQYVVFRLDGQRYGAPIDVVREVNYMTPITRLPNTPPYVDGVIDLRGEILPVVNLRARLNLAVRANDTETRLMILNLGDRSSALVVDGVEHVLDVREEEITAQEPGVILPGEDYVLGTARAEGGLVVILDLDRLMSNTL
ncbi:MAG: cheW1 [Firmicutes bacterium]|nr:cheW1 [Bacillota bacterium]